MPRSPRPFTPLLLAALAVGACKQAADLPVPFEDQLVVVGFVSPQDTLVQVAVARNQPLWAGGGRAVTDADVRLTAPDGSTARLMARAFTRTDSANGWCRYAVSARERPIRAGETYRLAVATPAGLRATATCTVPAAPVAEADVRVEFGSEPFGNQRFRTFRVTWPDAPGGGFFSLNSVSYVEAPATGGRAPYTYVTYGTAYLPGNGGTLQATERAIQGTNAPFNPARSFVQVFLCRTDRAYYDYHLALSRQQQEQAGNLFPEAVRVPGNVEGGLGIFAAYNQTTVRRYLP